MFPKQRLEAVQRAVCLALALVTFALFIHQAAAQTTDACLEDTGCRLQPDPTYMIVGPRRVRPGQVVQVYVTIFRLYHPHIDLQVTIRRDSVELTSANERLYAGSSRLLQLKMPDNLDPGNYTMQVLGSTQEVGLLFRNHTELLFQSKSVSMFIQTDKYLYNKRQWITYRVIAIHPNTLPVQAGSVNVYAKDPLGRICRRWIGLQLFNGIAEEKFYVDFPVKFGLWSIEAEGYGHTYSTKVKVENWFGTRLDVNLTMPAYVMEKDFALAGNIFGNLTNGMPVKGNGSVILEIRPPAKTGSRQKRFPDYVMPPDDDSEYPLIRQEIPFFNGISDFMFPLNKVREYVGDYLPGTELHVYVTLYDWYLLQEKTNHGFAVVMSNDIKISFLGGTVHMFKPRVPFHTYIAVHGTDGVRAPLYVNKVVRITTSIRKLNGLTENLPEDVKIVPETNIIKYTVIPSTDDQFIRITARYDGGSKQSSELTAYRHYTKTNHYITVSTSTTSPEVGHYMVYTVQLTTYIPEVHYQVVASGNIVAGGILFMSSTQKTFSLAVSRDMLPNARMLVFCLLGTGEVLADNINIHVKGIRSDNVTLRVNFGKDFSGNTIEINGMSDPGTIMAFAGAQHELYARGASPFLTEYDVEEELMTYDDHVNTSYKHTWWYNYRQRRNVHYTSPSYAIDANTTFTFAGLIVFTDADLTRIPGAYICNSSMGYLPCADGGCYHVSEICDDVRQCSDGADEMGCPSYGEPSMPPDYFGSQGRIETHYDHTQWLWKTFYTKPDGRIDFKIDVPFRPAIWLLGAIALNPDRGISLIEEPVRLETTRPFYIEAELPSASFKGEQLGLQVAAFNYWDQPLEAIIMLLDSDDYRYIKVPEYGLVNSYNPETTRGDVQTMVYLFPGEVRYIHMPILPVKTGRMTVTVRADCLMGVQTISKTLTVTYDGVTNEFHTPYLVDLISSGSIIIPDLEIVVPDQFVYPGQRWHLYVPGSPDVTVSVVGDVMGPGLTNSNMGLWNTLGRSSGQGETYVFDFALDLYWLKFLKSTAQLPMSLMLENLDSMNKDLTIVYSYLMEDGFFAMFRPRGLPSVWITAYGIETLAAAVDTEWEQILYIDTNIINKIALWLTAQQQPTGAFEETGRWFDRKMLDQNVTDEDGKPMNLSLSLTAYVAIALSKALPVTTGEAAVRTGSAMVQAGDYLANHLDLVIDPFLICIVTYALHVVNNKARTEAFIKMKDARTQDEFVYWSAKPIPKNRVEFVDTVQYLYPRLEQPHEGTAVQATSYALMVYLKNNYYVDSTPIMKWLQTQRNTDGGFASSQDTAVALQALSMYADRDTNRGLYTMYLNVMATSDSNWGENIRLHKGTFTTYHSTKVPKTYGSVRAIAQGTGYALLQMTTKVNVEYPFLLKPVVQPSFDLEVAELVFSGKNSSRMDMTVCAKWLRTDLAPRSGFVMIEVDIPTGFRVDKQNLRDNERWWQFDTWKRSRFTRQKVYMHIDFIPAKRTCFPFTGFRWYPVANGTIQHKVRVYELYEPGNHNTSLYTTFSLFHNHICLVCGSFQCPYCPYYNSAPPTQRWLVVWTSVLTFVTFILTRQVGVVLYT